METRQITVVSTKTQKKSVINSSATTLAELKADLRSNGIDYEGMTFYEGTSKTELKVDDSVLPHDVPYVNRTTGESIITNNLVIMLTNTNKKITSGAMSRPEAYAFIKAHGLEFEVKKAYGKNYTQVKTDDLNTIISKFYAAVEEEHSKCSCPSSTHESTKCPSSTPEKFKAQDIMSALDKLVNILHEQGFINHAQFDYINGNTSTLEESEEDDSSVYSNNEIAEMQRQLGLM